MKNEKTPTKNPAPKAAAPKSKIEEFGEALNKFVRANFDKVVEKKDGKVFLRGVDLGKGKTDFRIEFTEQELKKGTRKSHKRELYRIDADGKERLVQFGTFKKKYLYPLMNRCIEGRRPKADKIVINDALTKKIAAAIRADRSKFTLDKGVLAGQVKDVGAVKMVETPVKLKTGKTQIDRQLFIDGKLTLEGGQLGRIMNAFTHRGGHRSVKDVMAEANEIVSDLI
jgi:hypothetical protein